MTKFGKKKYSMFEKHKKPYKPKDPLKVDKKKAYNLMIPVLKRPLFKDAVGRVHIHGDHVHVHHHSHHMDEHREHQRNDTYETQSNDASYLSDCQMKLAFQKDNNDYI